MSQQVNHPRVPWRVLVGDQDVDDWLENARAALLFHSHSAMHQAIAGATGLSYHTVHKCLSGSRKPRRIPAAICTCLKGWLDCHAAGNALDIPDGLRAVPTERMVNLLPALLARFGTKSAAYEAIGLGAGIQPTTVRRYFCGNGQTSYAPLTVYRQTQRLARQPARRSSDGSYLSNDQTRRAAHRLASKCRNVLVRWKSRGHDPELEMEYRRLRRALITTIKEQRDAVPEECVL